MAEIPGPVWIAVGIFIGLFSLFLGFINPIETAAFFQLMTLIAIGMVLYGFVKLKFSKKSKQDIIDEMGKRRATRGNRDVEIDMEDYKNNPHLRQQATQHSHNFQQRYTTDKMAPPVDPHAPKHQTNPHPSNAVHHKGSKTAAFCSQCGSPLMKTHKFCPICGAKV